MSKEPFQEPETVAESPDSPVRNFLIGVLLSGIPIFAYLSLSVDMTYGSWAAVGTAQWVGAIALPLFCGILSAAFGKKVVQVLDSLLTSVQLPF